MQYIEPGSTSQSLVMYLQDSVTGGAYVTEDQADWTFNFIQEGAASATADATITAGTLGTWADGTSKPFGTTGLWQIDFANAAFAAGVKYVQLLVTHDNGDFIPKSAMIDLSVRQADAVEISGDSTSADNLELQYDTTGLTGDTFPATQAAVGNLTSGSAAINTTAKDAPNGFVITTGLSEVNDEDSTHALDGTTHDLEDNVNTTDCYYIFDVGGNGVPVSVTWQGYVNSQGDTYTFHAYNWTGTPAWEQIGSRDGVSGSTIITDTFDLTTAHVGTGANIGLVHFRIYSADGTKVATDRITCAYAVVAQSAGYSEGAIWVDSAGTAGSENYVNGTADNPCPWANALVIGASLGLNKFHIANGNTVTLAATADNYTLYGGGWSLALASQSIDDIAVIGAHITGTGTATAANRPYLTNCFLGAVTLPPSVIQNCGIGEASGTFTAGGAGDYVFHNCFSQVPGSGVPAFTFSGLGSATGINNRGWAGGSSYTLDSNCTISHEVFAGGGQAFVTGGANVELRGICRSVTLTLSGAGTVQFIGTTGPVTISGTATTTVNLYGISSSLADTSVNTTINDKTSSVTNVNGGDYALDTDANGRVRVVDGTGTGELSLASGVIESDMTFIHGTALTETSGQLAGSFVKFFNKSSPTGTINSIPDAVAGATGGLFIAGTNAETTVTTAINANIIGNVTGNLSGSVGSVTGAVGSVTGAVGSIGTGGITAASIANAAIDNATFAADVHSTAYASNLLAQAVGNALIYHNLDHLMKTAVASNADMTTEVPDGTVLSNILSATSDTSTFVVSTDSLEGLAAAIIVNAPTYNVEVETYTVEDDS